MNLPPNSYRKGRSDNSSIRRGGGPDGKTITGWTDVTGHYHRGIPDVDRMGADGLAQLEDGDTIRNGHTLLQKTDGQLRAVGVFCPAEVSLGPNDEIPPGATDNIIVGAFVAIIIAGLVAAAFLGKPDPVTPHPIPENYVPRDGTQRWDTERTYDHYRFPPPPNAEDRERLGLPPRPEK